jgi:protein-S-isoprenylcysteine O-methyltransferase Ste14
VTDALGLVRKAVDFGERLFLILLAIPFLWAFLRVLPTRPYLLLTAMSEMLGIVFILTRKPGEVAAKPFAVIIAFAGTALPLLVRPGGIQLAPSNVASILMFAGLAISIASKLYLNRSFGIVAANRGVKRGGPYQVIRHPMYLGYFATEVGFLLSNFSTIVVVIYAATWCAQLLRVLEEERVLRSDPAYAAYSTSVSFRIIPGLF